MTWREQAACKAHDFTTAGDPFFPEIPTTRGPLPKDPQQRAYVVAQRADAASAAYDDARRICGGCDVRGACLSEHLSEERASGSQRAPYGFAGGMTPDERLAILRERRNARRRVSREDLEQAA